MRHTAKTFMTSLSGHGHRACRWERRYAVLQDILEEQLARRDNKTVSCQPFHALLYPPVSAQLALRVRSCGLLHVLLSFCVSGCSPEVESCIGSGKERTVLPCA